ncbi:MAG TPA: nitroreductase family protein [Acidobacteriota bacterium]|nr:nitroreductase family protein [Acidobacteriota bacterium]
MSVLEIIRDRRSVRRFKGDPVPEETLARVLEAARLAPSAKNIQPWKFVVVRDRATKIGLAKASFEQTFMSEADIVIAACGFPERAYPRQGRYMNSWPIDLAIAFEHLVLQAAAEGLGTCWIGAFQEAEVKAILGVPDEVRVMAMTPLGWPAESPPPRGRKLLSEIVSYDRYR